MKAYLIDPFAKMVNEVTVDYENKSIHAIYAAIEADCFGAAHIAVEQGVLNTVYVDDEGLLKPFEDQQFFFVETYGNPLAGKGLVLGVDEAGETVEPTVSLDWLRTHVHWPTKKAVADWSKTGAFDITVTYMDEDGTTVKVPAGRLRFEMPCE